MAIDVYEDFDLRLRRETPKSRKYIVETEDGKSQRFKPPFSLDRLKNIGLEARSRALTSRLVSGEVSRYKQAQDIGSALFPCLLSGDVLASWDRKRELADKRNRGLRLRICCGAAPEMFDLPWEYAWNAKDDYHLATSERTPIVRCLDIDGAARTLKVQHPLRVLAVLSSPKGQPRLKGRQEWRRLTDQWPGSLEGNAVVLRLIEEATVEAVNAEIDRANASKEPYHIFHFIGHGRFNEETSEGELLFETKRGGSDPVSALTLGNLLRDSPFRLAVLNACEGGRAAMGNPFGGVAQRLVQQHLPAAIGMQYEIPDNTAVMFSENFYRAIAAGRPIEGALTAARKALYSVDGMEWAIPVLYIRTNTSRIFTLPLPPPSQPVLTVKSAAEESHRSGAGTPRQHIAIHTASSQAAAPAPARQLIFDPPVGAVDESSAFYIQRSCETALIGLIGGRGVSLAISAPGQGGRSSMLRRLANEAQRVGKKPVWLDLANTFPDECLRSAREFFREFTLQIASKLDMAGLKASFEQRWATVDNNITRCQECMRELLESLPGKQRVTLLLDGVDRLLLVDFRRDFFALLNLWHNERRPNADVPWNRLDIVLATSDEPSRLGLKFLAVPLRPFSLEEATRLNRCYGSPLDDTQLESLWKLLGGRPFLLQTCLSFASLQFGPPSEVLSPDCHPLAGELSALLAQVKEAKLLPGVREVVERQQCSDEAVFCGLRALGIIGTWRQPVQFSCPLYADYFKDK